MTIRQKYPPTLEISPNKLPTTFKILTKEPIFKYSPMNSFSHSLINLPDTNTDHKPNQQNKKPFSDIGCKVKLDWTCIALVIQINTNMGQLTF